MRKLFVLPVILASVLCYDTAFSAPRGRVGVSNGNTASAPKVNGARAAKTSGVKATAPKVAAPKASSNVNGARAAKTSSVKTNVQKAVTTAASANKGVGARAAAKQKVIQTGTKIAAATENNVVSQDCQDAYFGCMDSFCMIENASGGRCRCSDRNAELNYILDKITKLDEQSYAMATTGVEQIEMGEAADEVMAKAKAAEKKALGKDEKSAANGQKARKLDLSAWNNTSFEEDNELFFETESYSDGVTDKEGDALHNAAAKLCATQIKAECKASASMLKLIYAQKIKSDCTAYENSLKQQQSASAQKLQSAKQALREAALEKYQEANKMDLGECTIAFKSCMQTTGGCGTDWKGCVGLTAADNAQGLKADQTTIKGKFADITLGAASLQTLTNKKPLCESVMKQCVNESARVWETFLSEVAPEIKNAELLAEDDLRTSCLTDVADCFQKACNSKFDPNQSEADYDLCLSEPEMVASLCKVKLEPCLKVFGGTGDFEKDRNDKGSILWNGIKAKLLVMQVDACSKEVRECLTDENACGEDYSGCLGLSSEQIVNLCPAEKLLACQNSYDIKGVKDNVLKFASAIALNIDNNMLEICQSALKNAMSTYCGEEDKCPNLTVKTDPFKDKLEVKFCSVSKTAEANKTCSASLDVFEDNPIMIGDVVPKILNRFDLSELDQTITEVGKDGKELKDGNKNKENAIKKIKFTTVEGADADHWETALATLQNAFDGQLSLIESDPKVTFCMSGRLVQGFKDSKGVEQAISDTKVGRFPNLTNNVREILSEQLIASLDKVYASSIEEMQTKLDEANKKIESRVGELITDEEHQDELNKQMCNSYIDNPDYSRRLYRKKTWGISVVYDDNDNVCKRTYSEYACDNYASPLCYKWMHDPINVEERPSIKMKQIYGSRAESAARQEFRDETTKDK
ncbi:MAG: hypothetical protein MJ158_00705 [Alphaproteobacteria bacterium]|nr:hypothetical protein [Alphaproteobacteria bacterium]